MIDRTGIFKAVPVSWQVRSKETGSVAISIRFRIVAQLDEKNEWHDWQQYGEYQVFGDYWVIGKGGKVNDKTVEQLSTSLGWRGSLGEIANGTPPEALVQIKVDENTYNGKTSFRAGWMNPGDFVPQSGGEDAETVRGLDAQFGSLLRAAASKPSAPAGRPKQPPSPSKASKTISETDVPWPDVGGAVSPAANPVNDVPF